jgi:Zn finger protein HypA/HybF involved in hydrogenase expression
MNDPFTSRAEVDNMPFGEALKLRVKKRAGFRCCRCHEIGVEVHHIVPEEQNGPSAEKNAAPLCPNCHTWFGDNPKKRREITQMRDWWYDVCKERYGDQKDGTAKKLDELLAEVKRQSKNEAEREKVISEIKRTLKSMAKTSDLHASDSPEEVTAKVNRVVTASRLGENVHANVHCRNCGTTVGLLIGSNNCPTCGLPI